jgi:hypothetical protein
MESKSVQAGLKLALPDRRFTSRTELVPICCACKRLRDRLGHWERVDLAPYERAGAVFTHGICPECVKRLYPDLAED